MKEKTLLEGWRSWAWTLTWFVLPALLTVALWKPIFERSPFLLFLVGVVMATRRGGRNAGMAVAAGAAGVIFYLQKPLSAETLLTSLLTLGAMLLIAFLMDAAHRGTRAMREREVFENRMGDAVSDFVWSCDLEGRPFFLNRRHLDYIGLTLEQIQEDGWEQFIHPEDVDTLNRHFAEANRLNCRYECEARYRAADGSYRWFLCRGAPIQDEANRVVKWIGTSTDIHKRKQAELSLKTSQTRLTLALEHAGMGEWSWDKVTDAMKFSARAAEIFGVETKAQLTRTQLVEKLSARMDEPAEELMRDAFKGEVYDAEYRLRGVAGSAIWVSAKGRALHGEDGEVTGLAGIVQDITARKIADEEREKLLASERKSRSDAEAANRAKDEFVATLSHELRTPLNAILGWAQLLKSSADNPAEVREAAEVIERNTRSQAQLVEDLLDMSRIVSGKIRLEKKAVVLSELIRGAVETVSTSAADKGVALSTELNGSVPGLSGDSARLQQVISNLLGNAIKFTPTGGKVEIAVRNVGPQVEIAVADTGIGIAAEFVPHVFDRFQQAESGTSRSHSGLGLGLSIVKSLVEMHHGTVGCDSAGVGQGSVFRILLPSNQARQEAANETEVPDPKPSPAQTMPSASEQKAANVAALGDFSNWRVLVVDDNQDAREIARRVLHGNCAEIIMAASGEEALTVLAGGTVNLLISDIGMPGMDGFELMSAVRGLTNDNRYIPAIALTAFARIEDRDRAFAVGFDYFQTKPVEPADLLWVIGSLAQRQQNEEAERAARPLSAFP